MKDVLWIAVALPLIAGIQSFAVNYGYRGVSRTEAFAKARERVFCHRSHAGSACALGRMSHSPADGVPDNESNRFDDCDKNHDLAVNTNFSKVQLWRE
jgi:hypothetical protein